MNPVNIAGKRLTRLYAILSDIWYEFLKTRPATSRALVGRHE